MVILRRLLRKTNEFDLLPPEQFGFRRKHSTELQLLKIQVGKITEAGVPQGVVLTPKPYKIFISHIPRTANTSLALFADDTPLMSSSWRKENVRQNLQLTADELQKWYIKWQVNVKATRSQAIIIRRERDKIAGNINLDRSEVQWASNKTNNDPFEELRKAVEYIPEENEVQVPDGPTGPTGQTGQ
ncbi:hypothetical protein D910_09573 [Dendroctonus ponderosae]|uniref:Reverse transcriptase domain-containing protein n=1 Tax=Dendroctonus ponderosae TaxID=77166 RepID=U4UQ40_DENPD|nr:hypothetical protein D910_09573 [Dendroctonus ponderosae]